MNKVLNTKVVFLALVALLMAAGTIFTFPNKPVEGAPTNVAGVVTVAYGDPPIQLRQPHRIAYTLTEDDGQQWSLQIPPGLEKASGGPQALNLREFEVNGEAVSSDEIKVASLRPLGSATMSSSTASAIAGSQKFATLLCKFSDIAAEPQDDAFFSDLMGGTKPGLDHFWQENSYNNINLAGSFVKDWQDLPDTRANYVDDTVPFPDHGVDLGLIAQDCATAHDGDTDFSGVFGINFIFNADLDCCAWGGDTVVVVDGFPTYFKSTWMPPWAWTGGVFAHEMSHAFSLPHEGCQGSDTPYDSPWDSVSAAMEVHTSSPYKDKLAWIPGARKYTADNSNNQILNLERLAMPNAAGYLMAEIPLPDGKFYTVEARKFVGYDTVLPTEAVVMHIVDFSLDDKDAQVIRKDQAVASCGTNGAWKPGDMFKDPANNINIAVVSEFSSGFTIAINPTADLKITKTATPNPAIAGQQLTYNITVTNEGDGPAVAVIVTDDLPDAVGPLVSSTIPCAPIAGGDLNDYTCALGSILAGDSTSFQIVVDVPANIVPASGATTITNDVSVATDTPDTNLSNNSSSLTTTVVDSADLRILKECKPDQPNKQPAGVPTFCDIYVDNLGPSDAKDVVIKDTIIAGPALATVTGITSTSTINPAAVCGSVPAIGSPSSDITITCTDTVLPVGARDTIRVTFLANDTTDVNDTATVTSGTPDPVQSNNSAIGRVSIAASANLSLTKAAPVTATAGTTFNYVFTVTNAGPSTAENVVLTDTFPAGVEVQSVTPGLGNTCQPSYTPLTCNLGNLADGAVEVVSVSVKVKANLANGTVLLNNANVTSSTADPNTGDNSATASTTVATSADLQITKTADAAQYKPNSTVIYKLRVVNNGPSDAQNVVVVDTLPEQKQAIYQSDTGGCVFQAPKTLTCNIGTMASGEIKEIFVYVKVKGAQGDVTNSASISSTTVDPAMANNTSTVIVQVKGGGAP